MFIPHHMCVCKYIYRYSHPLLRRPSGVVFRSSCFNDGQAADVSYTALIGLTAAIRIHYRARPASHCCTGSAAVGRGHCRAGAAVDVRSIGRLSF